MDDTQVGSEGHDDRRRKLWTHVFLGLTIGGLYLLRRHKIKRETETADEDSVTEPDTSLSDIKTQLDRIESTGESIKEQLDSQQRTARFYVLLSLGIAFIAATPGMAFGLLGTDQVKNLTPLSLGVLFGGILMMAWAVLEFRRDYRRNIATAGTIATLIGTSIVTFLLLSNVTSMPTVVGIGWLVILLGLILMIIAVRSAGNR